MSYSKHIALVLFVTLCDSPAQPSAPFQPVVNFKILPAKPSPPPKPVFDVRTYGAKGDGSNYDTAAIQKTIDACAGSGGSVYLSGGRFLSAQLTLKGGMTLYIEKDATLLGGIKPEDYPILVPNPANSRLAGVIRRSLLYANLADNLTLDGGGTIDGQGAAVRMNGAEPERPSLIRIFKSNNVTVRNLSIRNPRMWTQVYMECNRLLLDSLDVSAPPVCANLDGMDICDCHDVIIRNCRIFAEDDGICLKSSSITGLKNISITHNIVHCYHANGIKIGTGTRGPIEDIRIIDNIVTFAKYAGLCLESVDGSVMSNVKVSGLEIYRTAQPFFIRVSNRGATHDAGKDGRPPVGSISNVTIENVRVLGGHGMTAPGSTITSSESGSIKNVVFKNVSIQMLGGVAQPPRLSKVDPHGYPQSNIFGNPPGYGFFVQNAKDVSFEDLTIGFLKSDVRPWLASDRAQVKITRCKDLKTVQAVAIPDWAK